MAKDKYTNQRIQTKVKQLTNHSEREEKTKEKYTILKVQTITKLKNAGEKLYYIVRTRKIGGTTEKYAGEKEQIRNKLDYLFLTISKG